MESENKIEVMPFIKRMAENNLSNLDTPGYGQYIISVFNYTLFTVRNVQSTGNIFSEVSANSDSYYFSMQNFVFQPTRTLLQILIS